MAGGNGTDSLISSAGADSLSGGQGQDFADFTARVNPLVISLDDIANDGEVGAQTGNVASDIGNIFGGSGDDFIDASFLHQDPVTTMTQGEVANFYTVQVFNRTATARTFRLEVIEPRGATITLLGTQDRVAPYSLSEIAEALICANGRGRFEIREFPAERKRIDIGDFITDDRRFRELAQWQPRLSLAEGLTRSLEYYRSNLASYV